MAEFEMKCPHCGEELTVQNKVNCDRRSNFEI